MATVVGYLVVRSGPCFECVLSALNSWAISAYIASSKSNCWAWCFVILFFSEWEKSRDYIRVTLDGGNTVPGNRILFVWMCVTLGEGLYR